MGEITLHIVVVILILLNAYLLYYVDVFKRCIVYQQKQLDIINKAMEESAKFMKEITEELNSEDQ